MSPAYVFGVIGYQNAIRVTLFPFALALCRNAHLLHFATQVILMDMI